MVLSTRIRGDRHDPLEDAESSPILFQPPFPYVLVCSTFGTILSLATVWIVTVHSVAQAMVA
jgi:hypothetical protein